MKHLSEDELIELYYGEAADGASAHQQACRECSARFAELQQSLQAIRSEPAARRGADYGERVWESLRPRLVPYEKKAAGRRAWGQWRAALLALGCVLLLAGTFAGGRYWERITTKKANVAGNAGREATQRVVLVVLADHLDRSERLLVALEHADPSDPAENAQLQSSAQGLLASNRLYRATASHADDPQLAGALDQLEGVLAEVANDPNLTSADLKRVRNEMNAEGILFEIRVLMARQPDEAGGPHHAKGASI
ncbi:MAG TPA: hypothetical protein VFE06_12290 [Acidobacteriaceae bacterium]|jgi:hypothetical protein|nr:hypothetical protein [Acidobacteriaceae bacterium]